MNGIIRDRVNSFYKDLLGAEFLSLLYYSGGIITGSSLLNIIIDNNAIPTPIDIDIFIPIQKLHNIFKSLKDGFIYSNSSVININNRSHLWINMKGDKINLDILVTTVDPLIILSEVDFTITMNNLMVKIL